MICCVGLYQPKCNHNISSVLRLSYNFNVNSVFVTGKRYKHTSVDTTKAFRHLPLIQTQNLRDVIPHDCVPVGVDLVPSARKITNYCHPKSAFYIFGPEDGTLGDSILSWCRDIIYIPTNKCLNLANAVSIVLYDRLAKLSVDRL